MAGSVSLMRSIRALRRARSLARRVRHQRRSRVTTAVLVVQYGEADGDFEVEVSALHAPTHRFRSRRMSRRVSHWRGAQLGAATLSRGERLRRVTFVCALLALALLGTAGGGPTLLPLFSGVQPVAGAPLAETLAQAGGIACLRDDAWSPDSRYFAYAGSTNQGCGYGQYAPNAINIYRARDAILVRQLTPDPAIFAALGRPVPPSAAPGATPTASAAFLMYDTLLYSRDGQRFALVFELGDGSRTTLGVAVVRASDGHVERVVLGDHLPSSVSSSSYAVWDLEAGSAVAFPNSSGSQAASTPLAPTRYGWTSGGQLVPLAASAGSLPGAIGDPSRDASFSVWQPGTIQLDVTNVPVRHAQEIVYIVDTQVAAWSPDGRYLAADFAAGGRVQPSEGMPPDAEALRMLLAADLPLLPLRDAGLDSVLRHVRTPMDAAADSDQSFAWIAYRPDGRALALLDDQQDVTIYAASTGAALRTFTHLDLLLNPHNESGGVMRWSPDGTTLLLPDGSVLRVGALGL